ncbi:MAG: RidA family protein [Vicinamibacterales bacterium]
MRVVPALLLSLVLAAPALAQSRQVIPGARPDSPFSAAVKADGLIFVSGMLSQGADVGAQTRATLQQIDQVLQKAGSRLANAVSVTVFLKNQGDFAAMNDAYKTFWTADPPVRTTVVAELVVPSALVEISVIAVPDGGERVVIHPEGWLRSPNPYSYGIRTGNTLFLAGLVSRNGRENTVVEGDMAVQAKQALDNAGDILKSAGFGYGDVVQSRVFISDLDGFQAMNGVYRTYFESDPPVRATVVAPLTSPQYLVEVSLLAVKAPRTVVTTPAADGTPGRASSLLSSSLKVGNRLYLSGMLGSTDATKGDMEGQTREALARLVRTLEAAGYAASDVVDATVYITDVNQFAAMNRAYQAVFTSAPPARATVRTGLVSPGGLVEIMLTAVK